MKILGKETRRYNGKEFFLYVVDDINSIYSISVKYKMWTNAMDIYRKRVFTNGKADKIFSNKEDGYLKVDFKVNEGDWLVVYEESDVVRLYISEQYLGPIQVKNKLVQETINICYKPCRDRISSKRQFAKKMGAISKKLNIPFQIVLAFKGNEEVLTMMTNNINDAINNKLYDDADLMNALAGEHFEERKQALERFGIIKLPDFQSEKIAKYIYQCLEQRKVISP